MFELTRARFGLSVRKVYTIDLDQMSRPKKD